MKRIRRWILAALVPWVLACGLIHFLVYDELGDKPDPGPIATALARPSPTPSK